jgi:glutaredoxin 3
MEYREINLDSDGLRAEFMSAYPEARQMPQIFFDGQRVGGLAGLQVALNQLDLL